MLNVDYFILPRRLGQSRALIGSSEVYVAQGYAQKYNKKKYDNSNGYPDNWEHGRTSKALINYLHLKPIRVINVSIHRWIGVNNTLTKDNGLCFGSFLLVNVFVGSESRIILYILKGKVKVSRLIQIFS